MCHCQYVEDWTAGRQVTRHASGLLHASFSYSGSKLARLYDRTAEGVRRDESIPQGLRVTKDVPILRAHHFAIQVALFGVWKVAERSLN